MIEEGGFTGGGGGGDRRLGRYTEEGSFTAVGGHGRNWYTAIESAAPTILGSLFPPLRPDICSALGLSLEVLAQAASCLVICFCFFDFCFVLDFCFLGGQRKQQAGNK